MRNRESAVKVVAVIAGFDPAAVRRIRSTSLRRARVVSAQSLILQRFLIDMKLKVIAAFLFLILASVNLFASGAGDVQLAQPSGIKIDVKSIFIKPTGSFFGGEYSLVEVNYIFENATDNDITMNVAVKMPRLAAVSGNGYIERNQDHNFNFKLWVNNAEQKYNDGFQLFVSSVDVSKYFKGLYKHYYDVQDRNRISDYIDSLPKQDKEYLLSIGIVQDGFIDYDKKVYFSWPQTFPANKKVYIKYTYITPGTRNEMAASSFESLRRDPLEEMRAAYNKGMSPYDGLKRLDIAGGGENNFYLNFWYRFDHIFKTGANADKPIQSFNLLVEGPVWTAVSFEGQEYLSPDKFFAKNITDFTPEKNLAYEFVTPNYTQYVVWNNKNRDLNFDVYKSIKYAAAQAKQDDVEKNIKYSSAKLYKVDGPANVRDDDGKIIASIPDGVYVWVVEQKSDWSKIVYNDLRGWTNKQNLVDIWNVQN